MTSPQNCIRKYAADVMKSERARVDGTLIDDFEKITSGCFYLPNFFCESNDYKLLEALTTDLQKETENGMINWSKHLKHEDPQFSPTFQTIVNKMSEFFDVEVYATRLNFYRDGSDWKPFHHDSHAYGGKGLREDFTMGASFGAERELCFRHEVSGHCFSFPQKNGDIFAFNYDVNQKYTHGIPKARISIGPRFSIIAWGRRRTINERNGGQPNNAAQPNMPASTLNNKAPTKHNEQIKPKEEPKKEKVLNTSEVAEMVQKLTIQPTTKTTNPPPKKPPAKKTGRLQSGPGAVRRPNNKTQ